MAKKETIPTIIDTPEALTAKMAAMKEAQKIFATYTQEQVDKIFKAAATAADKMRIPLAKMTVEETGMGIMEDKVIKNHYAAEYVYNAYKNTQTCGVVEEDKAYGIKKILEPVGLVAAVIPTTNPTSTAIFKSLISLKTRNAIIISPHPRAKKSTIEAAKVVLDAAVAAGAPEGIIGWIDIPSLELTNMVMQNADIILATGGPGMVKAAYSSGKPAVGVGPGNTPAIIDDSADIRLAVNSIIHSKTFDNGMICASEQSVTVLESIYKEVKEEFLYRGCYFLKKDEIEKVRKTILINGALNAKIVGQKAATIAEMAGVTVPAETKILIGEVESVDISEEFAHEKLSPVLAMYKAKNFDDAIAKAERLVADGGYGHTSSLYINVNETEKMDKFEAAMKTCRILINTPSSQGGIGHYVMTTFYPYQWDLNYGNPRVFNEMMYNFLFLANQGMDVIRIDAVPYIWKELGTPCRNLKQVHTIVRMMRMIAEIVCPSVVLLGEVVMEPEKVVPYFGTVEKPECHMLYNVTTMATTWNSIATRDIRLLKKQMDIVNSLPKQYTFLNYLRCHDDIGWGLDFATLKEWGMDEPSHKRYLNDFFTGKHPGSDSRGELYNDDPVTQDARFCGTTASMCGIEAALFEKDDEKLKRGIREDLMLHAYMLTQSGIPMLYSSDEIGRLNDYSYKEDPDKAADSRYIHRGAFQWELAEKRNSKSSVEGQIFQTLSRMEQIRSQESVFDKDCDVYTYDVHDDSILCILRQKGNERFIGIFNFSDSEKTAWMQEEGTFRDLITDQTLELKDVELPAYGFMWCKRM